MKRKILRVIAIAGVILGSGCGSNGPTGPSPTPGATTTTPGGTTKEPGSQSVPDVAGLYRGNARVDHQAPGGGGGVSEGVLCMDVRQEGAIVSMEPWGLRGTLQSDGTLEDVEITTGVNELHSSDIRFVGTSLQIDAVTSGTGSEHRWVQEAKLEWEGPPTESCGPQ